VSKIIYHKKKALNKTALILVFLFIFPIFYATLIDNSTKAINQEIIQLSAQIPSTKQWIKNPNFTSQEFWNFNMGELGDPEDGNGSISGGQANYNILGEKNTIEISGIPNSSWIETPNYEWGVFPDPGDRHFDENGCWIQHHWDEGIDQTGNTVSVLWKKNITLPKDLTDYRITSAYLDVVFNASAHVFYDSYGIEVIGDNGSAIPNRWCFAIGDYARFYAQVEDLNNKFQPFQLAENRTRDLGRDFPAVSTLPDASLESIQESLLCKYLEYVLSVNSTSFTMVLGIDIFCEDNNNGSDYDFWDELRIKSYNLTFSYEKKIDQLTSLSWNQDGDKISDISNYTVIVTNAMLDFNYKIDQIWPTALSPNSEIRILINNHKHSETIKLSAATTSFQEAKLGGFDLTSLIKEDVNLSLQVFIADEFRLNQTNSISIDEVSLLISYIIIEADEPIERPDWSWLVYTLGIGIIGLVTIFSLYQVHFKYPPMVRKIRKLKKKIRKGKKTKLISFNHRNDIINSNFQDSKNILKLEQAQLTKSKQIDKIKKLKEGDK